MNDPHLEMLITLADQREWEVGVTLAVGGALIGGLVVNRTRYLRALEEHLAAAPTQTPENLEAFTAGIRNVRIDVEAQELHDPDDPDDPDLDLDAEYDWINLINTVIHVGSRSFEVGPWRGKLTSVDGWNYGVYT